MFILGAGFSAGGGIPMTGSLLSLAMKRFREESPGLWSRVDGYVRACFGLESEPAFAKAVVECTPIGSAIPDVYLHFARQLQETDVVISFNWDCLLEAAVDQVGRSYSHAFEGKTVPLAKLHGSIDWRLGLPDTPQLMWRPVGFNDGLMQTPIHSCSELRSLSGWTGPGRGPLGGETQPLIVLPGYGKAFDVRHLAWLWYRPEFAFGSTHDVFIIGLSLSRDDFIVRSLFLHNLPYVAEMSGVPGRSIYIVNPDPATRDNYAFLLGLPFVRFLCEPFGETHIAVMEKCLP